MLTYLQKRGQANFEDAVVRIASLASNPNTSYVPGEGRGSGLRGSRAQGQQGSGAAVSSR